MKNNIRFDLSNYLIHFFRDVNLESDSAVILPDWMGWNNIHEGTILPAIYMLRSSLKTASLWATWSYRNNKPTIYGRNPVICFTDMPIAAFFSTSYERRCRGEHISSIGYIFPKKAFFQIGARPVIYGASLGTNSQCFWKNDRRMLHEEFLNANEQYRYLVYDIDKIDWTHEREWRWPYRGDLSEYDNEIKNNGIIDSWTKMPRLDFSSVNFQGAGVIVETEIQAEFVISDILTLIDNKKIDKHSFTFILVADKERHAQEIINPESLNIKLQDSVIELDKYLHISREDCDELNQKFNLCVETVFNQKDEFINTDTRNEPGGCWLWFHDNKSPIVRALLEMGRVFVTDDGRYLATLNEFNQIQSLDVKERMTMALARLVAKKFNTSSCYYSILNGWVAKAEAVPFYCGDHDSHTIPFYNYA